MTPELSVRRTDDSEFLNGTTYVVRYGNRHEFRAMLHLLPDRTPAIVSMTNFDAYGPLSDRGRTVWFRRQVRRSLVRRRLVTRWVVKTETFRTGMEPWGTERRYSADSVQPIRLDADVDVDAETIQSLVKALLRRFGGWY